MLEQRLYFRNINTKEITTNISEGYLNQIYKSFETSLSFGLIDLGTSKSLIGQSVELVNIMKMNNMHPASCDVIGYVRLRFKQITLQDA